MLGEQNEDLIQDHERDIAREYAAAAHKRMHENLNTNSIPVIKAKNTADD